MTDVSMLCRYCGNTADGYYSVCDHPTGERPRIYICREHHSFVDSILAKLKEETTPNAGDVPPKCKWKC